jgi:hypothetical protein
MPVVPFDGEGDEGVPGVGQVMVTPRDPDREETTAVSIEHRACDLTE